MPNSLLSKSKLHQSANGWKIPELTVAALLVALWTVLSVYSLPLKILLHEAYLPIFYFLIWITGLLFTPVKAFATTLIGHFFFDLIYLPNPLFLFVWIASAVFAATIARLKTLPRLQLLLYFFPPLYYLCAFFIIGYIQFDHPYQYFFTYPGITMMLLIGNPLFNIFVAQIIKRRPHFFRFLFAKTFVPKVSVPVSPLTKLRRRESRWTSQQRVQLRNNFFALFAFIVLVLGIFFSLHYYPTVAKQPRVFVLLNHPTAYADKAFNQLAIEGACQYFAIPIQNCNQSNRQFRANIAYGFAGTAVNPRRFYEYITSVARTKKIKIFILPGYNFTPFLAKYVRAFTAQNLKFIGVTTNYQVLHNQQWPNNLYQFKFQEQKAGFFAGLYSGLFALLHPTRFKDADLQAPGRQIKFASMGILPVPAVFAFALGFKAGIDFINANKTTWQAAAKTANVALDPNVALSTLSLYHEGFKIINGTDFRLKNAEVLQLAKTLYNQSASVIFSVASPFTVSIQQQAKQENYLLKTPQHWVVGVDTDQGVALFEQTGWESKNQIITSAIIDIARQVKQGLQFIDNGQIPTTEFIETAFAAFRIPARYRDQNNPVWKIWKIAQAQLEDQDYIAKMTTKVNSLITMADFSQSWEILRNKRPWTQS